MKQNVENPCRRIAVKTLLLSDGTRLSNQVLTLDTAGRLISYHTLTAEEAFCEWYRGEWRQS